MLSGSSLPDPLHGWRSTFPKNEDLKLSTTLEGNQSSLWPSTHVTSSGYFGGGSDDLGFSLWVGSWGQSPGREEDLATHVRTQSLGCLVAEPPGERGCSQELSQELTLHRTHRNSRALAALRGASVATQYGARGCGTAWLVP